MQAEALDVVGIGNAIVDVLSQVDDGFLTANGLEKGAMTLVDEARADELYARMGGAVECSGGSAANTMAGVASFGNRGAYVGKVRSDRLGRVFREDIRLIGVDFDTEAADDGPGTARCMVFVTPDAQRTMQTYLGASATLGPADVDPDTIGRAQVVYLEGYLWDPPLAKQAFLEASRIAHAAGRRVALSLSDRFCVERHREELRSLIRDHVDIVFANEEELLSLFETEDFHAAFRNLRSECDVCAVTRGPGGSVVADGDRAATVEAVTLGPVVDTTGAGDLYAAGFLVGLTRGAPLVRCGELGSLAAGEIIGHLGARPDVSLSELAGSRGLL
jgi:sugar/nucleoside kinase (ribokinase family)